MVGWKVRSFVAVLCLAVWPTGAPPAAPSTNTADGPVEFIDTLAQELIAMWDNAALGDDERAMEFRRLLNRGFDLDAISRFALGRYWRRATVAEREEFRDLFEELVVRAYSGRLGQYGGETLAVLGTVADSGGETIVRTEIRDLENSPVRADWRVRESGQEYRIVDLTVEGVSMAITQRDEFAAVIRSNGGTVEGLLRALREKTASTD